MDFETKLTSAGILLLIAERAVKTAYGIILERRRASGASLKRAFETTTGVIQELHLLYSFLKESENFHSLRLLSAHNSGEDLAKTMPWKSSILTTMPTAHEEAEQWQEQPLDHEYLHVVLRPLVEQGSKATRTIELSPYGALGAIYRKQGIAQSFGFLIKKTDVEIVYAVVAFKADQALASDQVDAIRICQNESRKRFAP